jgi:hypothetical protein
MYKIDTPEVRERLRLLENREGTLTPESMVSDARDKNSPLHELFEWDDATAAHTARIEQARYIIRTVRFEVTIKDVTLTGIYLHDPRVDSGEQGYVSSIRIKSDAQMARDVMHAELSRAMAAVDRAREVADVLGLAKELERALEKLMRLRDKAAKAAA